MPLDKQTYKNAAGDAKDRIIAKKPVTGEDAGAIILVDADGNDVTGAGGTGITQPTGGSGLLGWLSGVFAGIGTPTDAAATGNGSAIGVLKQIRALLGGSLAVTGTFYQSVQPVAGALVSVSATFTRPADTTAYTANDVVSNDTSATTLMAFSGAARVNGGSGYIVGIRVLTNKKSITPRFRVHIANATSITVSADNAAAQLKYADITKRVASYDLAAMSTAADTTNSDQSGAADYTMRLPFVAAAGSTSLYVWLETLDAFTPASGESFTVVLLIDQN